jgi:hypothetical protein
MRRTTISRRRSAFATELAEIFGCDRVSVGLSGRRHVKVHALSHSTEFKANQGLLRDIGAAMEEAIWQGATLLFPQPEGAQPRVDRAHATLTQRHGAQAICTVLLVKNGKAVGAMMFERNRTEQLTRTEFTLCENIGALLGPLIERKRVSDWPWLMKILGVAKPRRDLRARQPRHQDRGRGRVTDCRCVHPRRPPRQRSGTPGRRDPATGGARGRLSQAGIRAARRSRQAGQRWRSRLTRT